MSSCLIALGSNLGDRAATLSAALTALSALPQTRVVRASPFYEFAPLGGRSGQPVYLNAAALIETQLSPQSVSENLATIELRHGRQRGERWSARTIDLDLLLCDEEIIDDPRLVVPHPRMSFRPFVLEPAAEIAPAMVVPTIGWSIAQLWDHVRRENGLLAVVSPDPRLRSHIRRLLGGRFAEIPRPVAAADELGSRLWPADQTTWLSAEPALERHAPRAGNRGAFTAGPKLTILCVDEVDARNRPGRGPTLFLRSTDAADLAQDVAAAVDSAWPHLGRFDVPSVE